MFISASGVLVVFFVSAVLLNFLDVSVIFNFNPCSAVLNRLEFIFQVDFTTLICFSMLTSCSLLAFIYCFHYYYNELSGFKLLYLMLWFVLVMFVLVSTGSPVVSLILWEYLGFVSFLLILFYSNSSSVRASLVTLFCSRFGDVGLFVMIAFLAGLSTNSFIFFFFFLMVVGSKSASFPFISWLLEAMRAPTPVSSLVHSSTLVAAGVWFIVRYGYLVSVSFLFVLFVLSLFTIFVTGICAVFFLDLKKVVALSTCNNISWCVLYYTCGDEFMVLFQLIVHGVSKCLLFILVGDLMSTVGGNQSLLGLYVPRYSGIVYCGLITVLVFGLCGLPFLGIYFSKHCFFSMFSGGILNLFIFVFVLAGFCVSYCYSFRLVLVLCSRVRGINCGYVVSFLFGIFFVIVGFFISTLLGSSGVELSELSVLNSVLFLLIQVVGCVAGWLLYNSGVNGWFWNSVLWGNDLLVGIFYSIYSKFLVYTLVGFFRFEVWFCRLINEFFLGFISTRSHVLTLNFVVLGLVAVTVVGFCVSF
uniref:NADH:ubiquinone reductase (H(+)-translocating) n=1 Tax=Posthodiplostomum centrarchi TaxID=1954244 RepID=A0A6J3YMI4_9TREM|nr:NADH dehydrogenase subunit 5 [Posthodiplostomum centrarchi]